jgi:preprotein translocase SecE subunit
MSLEIYKKGQGKVARWGAYLCGFLLVAFGVVRLYANINVPFDPDTANGVERAIHGQLPLVGEVSVYKLVALIVGLLGLLGLHVVLNRPATVDLLIDTEQEMRKVSWPSRKEVQNATIVVILVTLTMAMLLFGFDEILQWLFGLVIGGGA